MRLLSTPSSLHTALQPWASQLRQRLDLPLLIRWQGGASIRLGSFEQPRVVIDVHVATGAAARLPVVPAIDDLSVMPAVDGAADLLLMHDASEAAGQKEKKITLNALRTALNIPTGAADEKVAVVSGGTAGYLWGTNGTDGLIRADASVSITKDAGNGFITVGVKAVDGGTF